MDDTKGKLLVDAGEALFGERWQAALAQQLDVNKDTVKDWKNGKYTPRPTIYGEVARLARKRRDELDRLLPLLDEAAK